MRQITGRAIELHIASPLSLEDICRRLHITKKELKDWIDEYYYGSQTVGSLTIPSSFNDEKKP